MGSNFGKHYPALVQIKRADERERLFFYAAAGMAAFLFFAIIFVLNFNDEAGASGAVPAAANPVPAAMGTVTLFAPDRPIPPGSRLADVKFKEVYWPRNQVPTDAVRDLAELRDSFAKVEVAEGMPLLRTHLTVEAMGVTLPVTPGFRAVSIEVDPTESVEGYALPGTRVDVVLTFQDGGTLKSKVLVPNARVLSYGGDSTPVRHQRAVRGRDLKRTITLETTMEDALTIATAKEMGRLRLLMRNEREVEPLKTTEKTENDVGDSHKREENKQCNAGVMKMGGREYVVGCDGSVSQVESFEP